VVSDIYLHVGIQKYIPDTINENDVTRRYHAKQFFEWFRDYKFPDQDYKEGIMFFNKLKFLYHCLKYRGIGFTIKKIRRTAAERV